MSLNVRITSQRYHTPLWQPKAYLTAKYTTRHEQHGTNYGQMEADYKQMETDYRQMGDRLQVESGDRPQAESGDRL